MYIVAAQYDDPPKYPVTVICGGIDRASANDTLGKIFAGLVAYEGIKSCYVNDDQSVSDDDYETAQGWSWQVIVYNLIIYHICQFFLLTTKTQFCHDK